MNIQDAFINALCESALGKDDISEDMKCLKESIDFSNYMAICINEARSNYTYAIIMLNKKHSFEEFEDYFASVRTQEKIESGDEDIAQIISKLDKSKYDFYVISGKDNVEKIYVM